MVNIQIYAWLHTKSLRRCNALVCTLIRAPRISRLAGIAWWCWPQWPGDPIPTSWQLLGQGDALVWCWQRVVVAASTNDNAAKSADPGGNGHGPISDVRAKGSRQWKRGMTRAIVIGGSLGGLTAALVLRDQGWDVDVLERSPIPLDGRGTGIVLHPTTVRYLVERAGKALSNIGLPARRLQYLDTDGSIAHAQPCAGCWTPSVPSATTCRMSLRNWITGDEVTTLSLTDGRTLTADLVVCADGARSTGRRIMVPEARPRYAGYLAWRGNIDCAKLSGRRASILVDAFTYRILPRGHLLT